MYFRTNHEIPLSFTMGAYSFMAYTSIIMKAAVAIKEFEHVPLTKENVAHIQRKLDMIVEDAKEKRDCVVISYNEGKKIRELVRLKVYCIDGILHLQLIWEEEEEDDEC